jgi:hypothetical protein
LRWIFPSDSAVHASAVGADNTIYFTTEKKIYALNSNGTLKWVSEAEDWFLCPAISTDGIIYVGTWGGLFYAFNLDGTVKWINSDVCGGSSPVIGSDGSIYLYGCDNHFNSLNSDGTKKTGWDYWVHAWESMPVSIDSDGTIYAGGWSSLNALNPDGTEKWTFIVNGFAGGASIGPDHTLYTTGAGYLHALNPDGTEKWKFTSTDGWDLSQPTVGSDGTIYVASLTTSYALNPDGSVKWTFYGAQPPVLSSDGTLYLVSGQTLYAVNTGSTGLADSPWPMLGHDLQHTSRQPYPPPSLGKNGYYEVDPIQSISVEPTKFTITIKARNTAGYLDTTLNEDATLIATCGYVSPTARPFHQRHGHIQWSTLYRNG